MPKAPKVDHLDGVMEDLTDLWNTARNELREKQAKVKKESWVWSFIFMCIIMCVLKFTPNLIVRSCEWVNYHVGIYP